MSLTPNCPKCQKQVTVPDGLCPDAVVRCPLCQAEYSISEALALLPPLLIIVSPGTMQPVAAAAAVAVEEIGAMPLEASPPLDVVPEVGLLAEAVPADAGEDVLFGAVAAEVGGGAELEDGIQAIGEPPAVPTGESADDAAPWNAANWHHGAEDAEGDGEAIAVVEDEQAADEGFGHVDFAAITGRAPAGEATVSAENAAPAPAKRRRPKREYSPVGRFLGIMISGLLALVVVYFLAVFVGGPKYDRWGLLSFLYKNKANNNAVATPQDTPKPSPADKPGSDGTPTANPAATPPAKPEAATETKAGPKPPAAKAKPEATKTKPAAGPTKKPEPAQPEVTDVGEPPDNPLLKPASGATGPEEKPEAKPTPKAGGKAKADDNFDPFGDTPEKEPPAKADPFGPGDAFAPPPAQFQPVAPGGVMPEGKPAAKPPAAPEAKPETKPESKPVAKPEAKPEISPFDLGEPSVPAAPAKPESKPEAKSAAKPSAAEAKPEPKVDVPPAGTIVPLKPPAFGTADLGKSLEGVGKPPAEITDQAYDKLRQLALVATYAKGETAEQKQAVDALAAQLAASPKAAEKIADLAKKVLADALPSGGIILTATVKQIRTKDGVQWVGIQVADVPGKFLVLSAQPIGAKENDRVLVFGAIVADPKANLANYAGSQPFVIWAGPAVKLP